MPYAGQRPPSHGPALIVPSRAVSIDVDVKPLIATPSSDENETPRPVAPGISNASQSRGREAPPARGRSPPPLSRVMGAVGHNRAPRGAVTISCPSGATASAWVESFWVAQAVIPPAITSAAATDI